MIEDITRMLYPSVFPDLVDGSLLRMEAGERLWKLYFLRPAGGRVDRVEHRIYTKEQRDGRIGLVSYNFRLPLGSRPVKTNLAYAKDIPKDTLNQIIWNVVRQTKIGPEEFEIVDLSEFDTFEEQVNHMRTLPQADGDE